MEIIKLNLIPSGVNSICHCSQYDNGRVIRLELFDGLTPYTLQSGDTVTLNVRKPDNTIITASVTATQGNNYVDIVTTEQMCAVVGNNLCDLTITNGSVVIGTLNFYMQVERDVLADGIPSQSVIEDLDALVQEAVGDQYYTKTEVDSALALKADKSDVYTKTEVDGTLVGELYNYIEDQVVLDNTGYPTGYTTSQSFSGKTNSAPDMPFYKTRSIFNAWYPASDLSGTYRYMIMTPPTSVASKLFQIGFWLYNDLTPTKSFKFGILPSRNSFDSLFSVSAKVGYSQTVGTATLKIDAEYNNWLHFIVTVDDSDGTNNTTMILLGSNHCLTSERVSFSPPIITLGNTQEWFINYYNPSYDTDNIIDDNSISANKTWSSEKISNIIDIDNALYGKKVNWIGDSIFYGGGNDGNNGWIGRISDAYGVEFESLAVNGAMIIDPNQAGYYSIANHCTDFTDTTPDFVIFDGGTNDGFNRTLSPLGSFDNARYDIPTDKNTSFSTAFEYIIYNLITAYPNSKIGYIIPYKQISYNQSLDVYDITGTAYFNRAIEICEKWGVPYLDLRKKSVLNYQIPALQSKFNDMVHINSDGYDYSYNIVAEWLKTL